MLLSLSPPLVVMHTRPNTQRMPVTSNMHSTFSYICSLMSFFPTAVFHSSASSTWQCICDRCYLGHLTVFSLAIGSVIIMWFVNKSQAMIRCGHITRLKLSSPTHLGIGFLHDMVMFSHVCNFFILGTLHLFWLIAV